MQWIWQQHTWPNFEYNSAYIQEFESEYFKNSGRIIGAVEHLDKENSELLKVEILCQEAVSTSNIEGEILDRDSVQSSIRKHLGLKADSHKVTPSSSGVSEMMVDLYLHHQEVLTNETLFEWHKMLMNGRRDIEVIGAYRQHEEPMQIVSGNYAMQQVFYEAPSSKQVFAEMQAYIEWFNKQATNKNIQTLAFAGIAHLYFEMIHPFEDGNGRIGRALVEKAISQHLKIPSLNSLSKVIDNRKKAYYTAIQSCNTQINIDKYLKFFCEAILEAQQHTIKTVVFLINKNKFFAQYQQHINKRQDKVLLRMFEEGVEGFKGGLSAKNYQVISGTSPATATRDLQELYQLNALKKTGELKNTRYYLNLEQF